jgi:hypothetical protein
VLTTEVASRLERKFGLGAFPLVRRRLYQRLQRLAVEHGQPVLEIIGQVEIEAVGPNVRDKGQYFCFVAKRRLAELGFPLDRASVPSARVPPAEAARNVIGALAAAMPKTDQQLLEESQRAAAEEWRQRKHREFLEQHRAEGGGW